MRFFAHPEFDGHSQVVFCNDRESGLRAIIALHDLTRGPALGGCRMWAYEDEEAALTDALRLSRGMTYKSALAELPYGGGKSVILGDPKRDKSPALFRAMGRFVESLGGRYIVAEDVGISVPDVETMAQETAHVAGVTAGGAGDPSPATAYGVFVGIQAAVAERLGRGDLAGVRIAVQGLGHVGEDLIRRLAAAGAKLVLADLDVERAKQLAEELGGSAVAAEAILDAEVEVFAPCALGGVIDDAALERLKASIVAGSANNQLAEARHAQALRDRGILYAPDYLINAGGIINISHEGPGYDRVKAFAHVARIGDTLRQIFREAETRDCTTAEAADRIAERRFRPGADLAA